MLNNNNKIAYSNSSSHLSSIDQTFNDQFNEFDGGQKFLLKDEYKWQILEGLKDGQRFEEKPLKFSGFMLKRRKRPLKGWP